ncbi:hypothetical protein [Rhizobium sp. RU35A]|uniref:hypothetical protein n=1 Tax=Rhizobium sp. RU35A TaxID=1907414 RepID=UPI00165EEA40|nr:hypothetical protein [Rhizobium sp. RU35A]
MSMCTKNGGAGKIPPTPIDAGGADDASAPRPKPAGYMLVAICGQQRRIPYY